MAKYLLLACLPACLLACLPAVLAQCSVHTAQPHLKRAAYEFAVELTARIAQEKENHFVASTLSPWSLLSTAALGAAGATLKELTGVLHLHRQPCFNDRYFEIVKSVAGQGSDVVLERSSTIFVDDSLRLADGFQRKLTDAGVVRFESLPFSNPDNASAAINDYVSRATHDMILDVVVPGDLDGVLMIMIDALYFKGTWQTPFPYKFTERGDFYNDRGIVAGDVNFMSVTATFNTTYISHIRTTVVELPYGADGRYAMLVFLPDRDSTLPMLINSLRKISLATVYRLFSMDGPQSVRVTIPRFKIVSDLNNLKELLSDMGLRTAFDSTLAEFPNLSDFPLYIANFVQKANIEVTEEGTEASAATAALFGARFGPQEFNANKPFLYMIVDKQTEVPIFTGAYSKPSEY